MTFIKGHKINVGRKYSPETIEKMKSAQCGRPSYRGSGWKHTNATKQKLRNSHTVHGHASRLLKNKASPTYASYMSMLYRCKSVHKNYGGRGIKVCNRWKNFQKFLEDMGECPKGKTIDRIDNKGNYELENCKWSTPKEQANNRRSNTILEYKGKKRTISQWSDITGIKKSTISQRIITYKWSIEKTLTTKKS